MKTNNAAPRAKPNKQVVRSAAHSATAEVPMLDPYDDDDFMLNMQEEAELGILNQHRRYTSHRVRMHPFDQ